MKRRRRRGESGQALVETAIIMPIMVFVVLGAVQLMMMQHGRIMTEYAAYNAARAGIVHNGNWNVMQNAAMIAAMPLYYRTNTAWDFATAWARVKAVSEATQAVDMTLGTLERLVGDLVGVEISGIFPDISLVEVEVTSPGREVFDAYQDWVAEQRNTAQHLDAGGTLEYPEGEIDFDDVQFFKRHYQGDPGAARLAVEVRILYPLRVPVVNWMFFQMWLAANYLQTRGVGGDLQDWAQLRGRVTRGGGTGQYLDDYVETHIVAGIAQRRLEARLLQMLANETRQRDRGLYLIPLRASYSMQMQSNLFESNRREPVWFTID